MSNKISKSIANIIRNVERNGDKALIALTKKYDGVKLTSRSIRVSDREIKQAIKNCSPPIKKAIQSCGSRIRNFHQIEKRKISKGWMVNKRGVRLGQVYRPVDSVGIYVPGGRFSYPSTVLMTAVPAQLAGVKEINLVTPPGRLSPEILVASRMAGVKNIFRIGGPASIAALALGTKTIPKVDFIVGPGNAWVTEAKRQLFGEVGIDLLAGPSELAVLADSSAPAQAIAADMCAQAEHDPQAKSFLVSNSKRLIRDVRNLIPRVFKKQCVIYLRSKMNDAIEVVNQLAAEHVEVMVKNPKAILKKIKNGGTIFINRWSPTAMGDYWAGPSHVLPTGQSARFASGLSVMTFLKRSSIVDISKKAYLSGWRSAHQLAMSEGLVYHAASLKARIGGKK